MRSTRFLSKLRAGRTSCLVAALLAVTLLAPAARAEWAIDAYLGPTFPEDDDTGGGLTSDFDGNITTGARVGYYLNLARHFDLGVMLDVSGVFQDIDGFKRAGAAPGGGTVVADVGDIDFNFVPISPLLFVRIPLGYTAEFIHGRYQLYGGGGPSLIWSEVNGGVIDDQSLDFGGDVRGGFNFLIAPSWGIFAEYRYTYFEPDYNDDANLPGFGSFTFKADVDSSTHHVLFGTGLRF
jgi:hypothetical protein